jgi:hypothetical protein
VKPQALDNGEVNRAEGNKAAKNAAVKAEAVSKEEASSAEKEKAAARAKNAPAAVDHFLTIARRFSNAGGSTKRIFSAASATTKAHSLPRRLLNSCFLWLGEQT